MPGKNALILVVEDEVELNEVIANLLTARGYRVLRAFDGAEALRLYRMHASGLTLVLCDINMPVMDGLDFLRASVRQFGAVPCVMLSAYDDASNVGAAVRLGAVDFVTKPTAISTLVTSIPKWQEAGRVALRRYEQRGPD